MLRVGLDSALGGIWGPILPNSSFEFVPFASYTSRHSPLAKQELKDDDSLTSQGVRIESYRELAGINNPSKRLSDFLPTNSLKVEDAMSNSLPEDSIPHYDPNFKSQPASYGDYWKGTRSHKTGRLHGRLPKAWKDIDPSQHDLRIFFHATLAPFVDRSMFAEQARIQKESYGVYLVGAMKVIRFVKVDEIGWRRAIDENNDVKQSIFENFHFKLRNDLPVIALGDKRDTFLTREPIPLKLITKANIHISNLGDKVHVTTKDTVRFKFLRDSTVAEAVFEALDEAK